MFITADRQALSTERISTSLSYLTVLRSGTGVTIVSVVFFALKILAAMSTIVQWRGSIGDSWYLYYLRRRTVFQTRNWVIGSPDQWFIWVKVNGNVTMSHTTSYSTLIETMCLSCTVFEI